MRWGLASTQRRALGQLMPRSRVASPVAAVAAVAAVAVLAAAFVTLAACSPAAAPAAAAARRVLFLSTLSAAEDAQELRLLREELDKAAPRLGTVALVPHNLAPLVSDNQALDDAVARLVQQPGWAALYTPTMQVAARAQRHSPALPIVFDGAANPATLCLVDSLITPGRNATGYTSYLPTEGKSVEALLDAYPATRQLVVLTDGSQPAPPPCPPAGATQGMDTAKPGTSTPSTEPPCQSGELALDSKLPYLDVAALRQASAARGVGLRLLRLCTAADLERLPAQVTPHQGVAVLVPLHYLFFVHSERLVQLLGGLPVPALYARERFLSHGGLMSLAPVTEWQGAPRAAESLVEVLAGHAPARLPVQTPVGFELRINVAAARAQGLPPSLLALRRAQGLWP